MHCCTRPARLICGGYALLSICLYHQHTPALTCVCVCTWLSHLLYRKVRLPRGECKTCLSLQSIWRDSMTTGGSVGHCYADCRRPACRNRSINAVAMIITALHARTAARGWHWRASACRNSCHSACTGQLCAYYFSIRTQLCARPGVASSTQVLLTPIRGHTTGTQITVTCRRQPAHVTDCLCLFMTRHASDSLPRL
jgi:hypothetical protein